MADVNSPYYSWATWEGFQGEDFLTPTEQPPGPPGELQRLKLHRDDDYALVALGEGTLERPERDRSNLPPAGTRVPAFRVEAKDVAQSKYVLECSHTSGELQTSRRRGSHNFHEFELRFHPYRVSRTWANTYSAESVSEWYLNGPRTPFIFTRDISWRLETAYYRALGVEGEERSTVGTGHGTADREGAYISAGDWGCFLYSVPSDLGPSWSENLAVEYQSRWGRIPSAEEREAVARLVSFVVGRKLLHVGTTHFDSEMRPFFSVGLNPRSSTPRSLCSRSENPPVQIVPFVSGFPSPTRGEDGRIAPVLEGVLEGLLPSYLEHRQKYGLDNAISRYLGLPEFYLDLQLPWMRSILESLANAWFKAHGKKSGGRYMSWDDMNDLIGEDLSAIQAKLATKLDNDLAERIARKMTGAFQMGMAEKFAAFFQAIDLPVGKVEAAAIIAASKGAHARGELSDEEYEVDMRHTESLKTLLNRVTLRLLGYEGTYIDYSSLDWPERSITEPLGGRSN